ncbi:hypothetical protein BGX34_011135 [Mortierella sp. NVP85]|nr:hypothetical protein BGX34_011135 [Mortierella sp. NVP85]
MSALPQTAVIITQSRAVKKRGSLAFPIKNLRRYVSLISQQATISASLIIKHPFVSPPVPTWPLHLTLFVAVIRATADIQEHIVEDISDIRRVIDTFFHYLPKLPQMHVVPFKIPIPAHGRSFPGVLEQLEQSEDGHRTLSGQWIADSKVWERVMKLPLARNAKNSNDPYAAREAVDYRLAPEHPYPAAMQDASHAFSHLTDPNGPYGFDPENVTASGDSAGGGLIVALMMYQRDHGMQMPSKAVLLSPWLDLTMSCESWMTNTMDYLPTPPRFEHKFNPISFYCSGRDKIKTLARHPYISPLWGNLSGLPPILIQCGEAERLRDECVLFTYKAGGSFGSCNKLPFQPVTHARHQSDHVELDMYPGMVHVFQAIPYMPESSMALQRMLEFMERKEADIDRASTGLSEMAIVPLESVAKPLQADQVQLIMEQLMEEVVESTSILSMEGLVSSLQLQEDELRLVAEDVSCQA